MYRGPSAVILIPISTVKSSVNNTLHTSRKSPQYFGWPSCSVIINAVFPRIMLTYARYGGKIRW